MAQRSIRACFKDGVFVPLEPVQMPDKAEVRITIQVTKAVDAELRRVLKHAPDLGIMKSLRREDIYADRD